MAGLWSRLHPPKERLQGMLHAAQGFPLNVDCELSESLVLAQFSQLSLLQVAGNSLWAEVPGVAALLTGAPRHQRREREQERTRDRSEDGPAT
jgi:hypothetical protein